MNLLIINGSPKGKRSNSLRLTKSFVEGFKSAKEKNGEQVVVEELELASMNIGACRGCFACWKNTPGVCIIKDDMPSVLEKMLKADLIVWSFPLYYFNVPGLLKNLIDRQLPMNLPFMSENTSGYGSGSHEARYDKSGLRHVLISTCGFYSAKGNYDSVLSMFDHFTGKGNYEKIFCGQGELFKIKELASRTDQYLAIVEKAGQEYAAGGISEQTKADLETLLYPKEIFEKMADASWGVSRENGQKETEDLVFTRQMASLYNKNSYDGKDRVLQMNYTDRGSSYQILLDKEGSKVYTDGSLTATTIIDTPYDVWAAISRGEMSGSEALGKQLYKVNGDFSLMMNWNKFFGGVEAAAEKTPASSSVSAAGSAEPAKPSMASMLIPWISFWVGVGINSKLGSLIAMAAFALVPLIMRKFKFVIWDRLSFVAVAALSMFANLTGQGQLAVNIGYLVFGLFWLISCLFKQPLCAAYVKYSYGGDSADKNPLFMRTNYILAACWGILYILTAVWTFFLNKTSFAGYLIIVNNLVPVVMGIFTGWFVKWYPARLARGK
ncbi:MAG: NAD(P)H-dependent oxidoreductase [Treponema sp.]|nr:NAD(P)H-dependent oxidoreductase [Treponema sp.]